MECDNPLGIKKVVDCKIEGGQQFYKVKWQATWEPAESLMSCQHLVEEFWSFVNTAKAKEEMVQQLRRKQVLEQHLNGNGATTSTTIDRLSEDSKMDVQRLIVRTNSTSSGASMVASPSTTFRSPPTTQIQHETFINNRGDDLLGLTKIESVDHKMIKMAGAKPMGPGSIGGSICSGSIGGGSIGSGSIGGGSIGGGSIGGGSVGGGSIGGGSGGGGSSSGGAVSNSASLKYVENFSNPYVKLIIVCKICNREASRFQNNWKRHYLTHLPNDEKPTPKKKQRPNNNNNNNNNNNDEFTFKPEYSFHNEY